MRENGMERMREDKMERMRDDEKGMWIMTEWWWSEWERGDGDDER
jgi:hypothetical protein